MANYIDELITSQGGDSATIDWQGGPGCFAAQGTFAGITLALKFQIKSGSWTQLPGTNMSLTADGMGNFDIFPCKLMVEGTGGMLSGISVQVRVAPTRHDWYGDNALL